MPGCDSMIGQRVFGGYILTNLLGEGGMGAVYVAENQQLGKKLAVKLLLPELSQNPLILDRFVAEARAASSIDHPNIIEVIDAGQFDDGRYYILMEHLEGSSLEDYGESQGTLATDTVLRVLVQVCAGLEAAHHRGIIHRDLKPANIFVSPRIGRPLFTKILDFGIAKLGDEALAGSIKTGTNVVMGTPSYMSPEQARGSRDVDQRSDVYALGVIAYQLLTRLLPYKATSLGSLVHQQLTQPPANPRIVRADLPEAWVCALAEAMSIEPSDRPQTVRAFANRLIEATPAGFALVEKASPEFLASAPADDNTTAQARPGAPMLAATSQPATVALNQPTTLSSAVGVSVASTTPTGGKRWLMAVGLVAVLAVGGITAGLLSGRGDDEPTTKAAATAPIDAAPAVREVKVRVESQPPGAAIYVDDERQAGAAPLAVTLVLGRTVVIRAELAGYTNVTKSVEAAASMKPMMLQLVAVEPAPTIPEQPGRTESKPKPTKQKSRKKRDKSKVKPATTPEKPADEPTKPERPFDPDAPA